MRVARVLVVDGDRSSRRACREHLAEAGHAAACARDAFEAMREISRLVPDLVVVDIDLTANGRELVWLLGRYEPELPVIVRTSGDPGAERAVVSRAAAVMGMDAGATELAVAVTRGTTLG